MTISLKANLDGTSGTIQVDSVDVLSLASNGNISTTGSVTSGSLSTGAITASGAITTGGVAAEKIRLETAQNTTSGTSIDFTGIPSWVKRITVMFNGVSTSGTSAVQIQLGTVSGFENSGYTAHAAVTQGTAVGSADFSTGFGVSHDNVATNTINGLYTITNLSSNVWTLSGSARQAANRIAMAAGSKSLSGTLDRIRITTVNGTDLFDAGSVNILLEGY